VYPVGIANFCFEPQPECALVRPVPDERLRTPRMAPRTLHKALWAAALAVLIQFSAPIWAMAMLAAEASDPFAAAPVCSQHPTPDDPSAPPSHHGSVCPLCQFAGHAGQLVLTTGPAAITPAEIGCTSRIWHSIAGLRAPPLHHAQARAPPAFF
jgi:hypothetical protein